MYYKQYQKKIMKILLLIPILIILFNIKTFALPSYSLLSGNSCINCHVNYQGGSLRNELGIYYKKNISIIPLLDEVINDITNPIYKYHSFLDGKVLYGFDFRYQSARPATSELLKRRNFVMQASPYISLSPMEWLKISGSYNFAVTKFPSQSDWSAYIQIQPSYKYPILQIGYFQPSIGLKYDDHTNFNQQIASTKLGMTQILAPDYSEYGMELYYQMFRWLNVTTGLFTNRNLSKIKYLDDKNDLKSLVDDNSISYIFKIEITPRFLDNLINTDIGASIYYNNKNNFNINNFYIGLGITDYLSLISQYTITDNKNTWLSNNISIGLTYQVLESLLLHARFEKASTDDKIKSEKYSINQVIIGGKVFILPGIILIPEYRIFDTEYYSSYAAQYSLQLHVFY